MDKLGANLATLSNVSATLGSIISLFKGGKYLYDRHIKKETDKEEKRKKLLVKCKPRSINFGWNSTETTANIFNINTVNPKNYNVIIIKAKLYEVKNGEIFEEQSITLSKEIIIGGHNNSTDFIIQFPESICNKHDKNWILRLIDFEDNFHDSNIFKLI
ncbi:hypothetical protein J0A68_08550 [Algoriphagus sp. H41]|uniref:Uncharacterized protein n=1 Tax=Algoriphagus oliviformis TaxID=2811231 RepID=A0ABS3C1L2_9BACT|nr:hypothetical protein [Algoriphagus oliviformis]MBN7811002.1 hypothetical protein [Algoriphagus oliviformis]